MSTLFFKYSPTPFVYTTDYHLKYSQAVPIKIPATSKLLDAFSGYTSTTHQIPQDNSSFRFGRIFGDPASYTSTKHSVPQSASFIKIDATTAIVEGSLHYCGLQPDYFITPHDSDLEEFLNRIRTEHSQVAHLELPERIKVIQNLVQSTLKHHPKAFENELKRRYDQESIQTQHVLLGTYVRNQFGTCREHALLSHLALREVGIDAEFVYVQHVYQGRVEDHAFNVVKMNGIDTVIDSYYKDYNFKTLQELWESKELLRVNAYPLVWQSSTSSDTLQNETSFTRTLLQSPLVTYSNLKNRQRIAKEKGKNPLHISFPEMEPVIQQALQELETHVQDPDTSALGILPQIYELIRQAQSLISNGCPYQDVVTFSRDFVETLEPLAAKKWLANPNHWVSTYFTRTYRDNFEDIALNPGEGFAFPWFDPVDMDFFIQTRASLIYIMGMRSFVAHTDGDPLGPSDFFYHDIEHALRQKIQTDLIFSGLTLEERQTVQSLWQQRLQHLLTERNRLARQDQELGLAFTYFLFELMHERGFAPDFQSLRDQTLGNRWSKVIERKLLNRFWFNQSRTTPDFATLEKARQRLHEYSMQQAGAELDQIRLQLLRGGKSPEPIAATIHLQKQAKAYTGSVASIEFEDIDHLTVALQVEGRKRPRYFPETQINLEQIRFDQRRINAELSHLYAKAVALKKAGQIIAVKVNPDTAYPEIYGLDYEWRLFDHTTAADFDFSEIHMQPMTGHTLYRLEQLLSLFHSGEETDALILKAGKTLRGSLTQARGGAGNFLFTFSTDDGDVIRFRPEETMVLVKSQEAP